MVETATVAAGAEVNVALGGGVMVNVEVGAGEFVYVGTGVLVCPAG